MVMLVVVAVWIAAIQVVVLHRFGSSPLVARSVICCKVRYASIMVASIVVAVTFKAIGAHGRSATSGIALFRRATAGSVFGPKIGTLL